MICAEVLGFTECLLLIPWKKLRTSTNAPSGVRIRMFGPLLHLPRQLTLTTGTDGGVRNVKVAKVASEPFSRHLDEQQIELVWSRSLF